MPPPQKKGEDWIRQGPSTVFPPWYPEAVPEIVSHFIYHFSLKRVTGQFTDQINCTLEVIQQQEGKKKLKLIA